MCIVLTCTQNHMHSSSGFLHTHSFIQKPWTNTPKACLYPAATCLHSCGTCENTQEHTHTEGCASCASPCLSWSLSLRCLESIYCSKNKLQVWFRVDPWPLFSPHWTQAPHGWWSTGFPDSNPWFGTSHLLCLFNQATPMRHVPHMEPLLPLPGPDCPSQSTLDQQVSWMS
jgi:hypothetical protein